MNYELKITSILNTIFKNNSINAIAFRLKQAKYCDQICDLLVDSSSKKYYLAIECKTTKYGLFFSSNFSKNQVMNISTFINKSGRTGVLALKEKDKQYLIPWSLVLSAYINNEKGIGKLKEAYIVNYKDSSEILQKLEQITEIALSEN
jgi:Holliday junction resolvase